MLTLAINVLGVELQQKKNNLKYKIIWIHYFA